MKKLNMLHGKYCLLLVMTLLLSGFMRQEVHAQDIYADQLINNSSDFQHPDRITDTNHTNYGYLSNLLSLLSTSYVRVQFPVQGKSGDVINIMVRGTGQLLGAGVLDGVTIKLYDSTGALVKTASGSSLLQLSLLAPGTGIYRIKYVSDITDNYTFKEARIEFDNVLTLNLLNEFRVYNIYFQQSCPPIYADSVFDYNVGGLLTSHVNNPQNAVTANVNDSATLVVPLNLLGLLDPARLDLSFSSPGHAGDYVGFTVSKASTILDLGLIQKVTIEVYDVNNLLVDSKNNFGLLDLKLLPGTGNRYMLGFVTQNGNYSIGRIKIIMGAVVGLFENLNVYNGFHFTIDRPAVTISVSGPTTFCQGDSVILTAYDSLGSTNYLWSNGATTQSITVSQSGTYYVEMSDSDSLSCMRNSIPIEVNVVPNPTPVIVGDSVLCVGASGVLNTASAYAGYVWSDNTTANNLNIQAPGNYFVTVTDTIGCIGSDTVVVTENELTIAPSITASTCSNTSSGSISLNVSGGSGAYTYQWSNGGTTASINNLEPGLYVSTISDNGYGCIHNRAYTVTASNTLSIQSSVVNTSTCGASDGEIAVSVVGGSGNYTYAWSNGGSSAAIDHLSAGIYRVSVTDNTSGCLQQDTILVDDGNSSLVITPSVTAATSCNSSNGSVSLSVTGGSGSYSYLWSTGSTLATVTGLSQGIYYAAVTDNTSNCVQTIAVTVGNSASLTLAGSLTPASCSGADGSINASVTGGSGSYTYSWSNGMTTSTIQNLQAGTYVLQVTDIISGCFGEKVFTLGETGGPVATLTATQPNCATNNNGSISIAITGSNFSYLWSNGSTVKNQTNLKPGLYIVTITNTTTGCKSVYSAVIAAKPQIDIVADVTSNTGCAMGSNGMINVSITGGVSPFTYSWSGGQNTEDINGLAPGDYTLMVSDANGCTANITVPVTTDSAQLLAITQNTIVNASCNAATNGSATVTVTGGAPPYSYSWSSGATSANLSGVSPGIYSLTVTDSSGCTAMLSVTIGIDTINQVMAVLDSVVDASCANAATGAVFVTTSGGAAPYAFSWSNGTISEDLSGIVPGNYNLTVTDNNGCNALLTATVGIDTMNQIMPVLDSVINSACANSMSGAAFITTTGGQTPYTYAWSNGATTEDLLNVSPNSYSLVVTDNSGCTAMPLNVVIGIDTTNQIMPVVDSVINSACANSMSGAAFITTTGGQAPYTYAWSNGATTEDLLNVSPDSYSLVVTDNSGCTAMPLNVVIGIDTMNQIMPVVDSVIDAACSNSASGAILITTTGGQAPYTYAWSNGATTEDLLNVEAGSYNVVVTDNSGCSALPLNVVIGIDTANQILVTLDSVMDAACSNSASGAVYITTTGGSTPYVFAWTNGATTEDLHNVIPGNYGLLVTDNSGCTSQPFNATVGTNTANPLMVSLDSVVNANCSDPLSGAIYVSTSGGATPYSYSWSNGSISEDLLNVPEGSYNLVVTDNRGCTDDLSASISAAQNLVLSGNVTNISCYGLSDGKIGVSVSSGSGSYSYSWSTGSTTSSLSGLSAGDYTVDVTDAVTGCSESGTYTVTEPDSISIVGNVVNDTCTTVESDGSITLDVTGGTAPYGYAWSDGSSSSELHNLPAGTYSVTVTDNNACTQIWSGEVIAPECDFTLDIFNVITPNGDGANDSWYIQGLEYYPQNEVKVFDKWGDLVFEKKGYDGSWSGTKGTNGPALPDGTYFYLIKLNGQNIQGGKNEFTGSLLIQR